MKILMSATPDGGIGQYSHCLANSLVDLGHEVTILTHDRPPSDTVDLERQYRHAPRLHRFASRTEKIVATVSNLAVIGTMSRNSDIFHSQWTITPTFDRAAWRAMRAMRKPIVLTLHDVIPHERHSTDVDHNVWLARSADAVIVHGQRLRTALLEMADIAADRVSVIPHGNFNFIADDASTWDRKSARTSLGIADHDVVVLFFGFIREYKGLDILIEAFRQLCGARPDLSLRLLIAGRTLFGNGLGSELEQAIQQTGIGDRVVRHIEYIATSEVGRFFSACDIVAMPYRSGSQSGVMQMAYAFGRPAVVTDVGSIAEVAIHGETALVVPPGDSTAFASGLEQFVDDPAFAARLGAAGRDYADRELAWAPIAKATETIYRSVIDS